MPRRPHLRTRVLVMTGVFAAVLFAVTFGLTWRARQSQQRWSHLIRVETEAITALDSIIRAQNAFHSAWSARRDVSPAMRAAEYRVVEQLLATDALQAIDASRLRGRMKAYAATLTDPEARAVDLDLTSEMVVREAQRMVDEQKLEIAHTLPDLEHDTRSMMESGLAVAWILMLVSFALVQTMLKGVVRPLEDLSAAADRIAAGDLTARARVAGDREIARVAVALNGMADELRAHARTDELTGMPNFRAFTERIDGEIERAARYPTSFGILVLDLDRFKKYNDTYGHLAGNEALRRVAAAIRETVRSVDFAARYGGEEFAVILPEVGLPGVSMIAERIRVAVQGLPAPADGATVTVSIGAAIYPLDGGDAASLFHAADERLYAAKHAGRNRVVVPTAAVEKTGT